MGRIISQNYYLKSPEEVLRHNSQATVCDPKPALPAHRANCKLLLVSVPGKSKYTDVISPLYNVCNVDSFPLKPCFVIAVPKPKAWHRFIFGA